MNKARIDADKTAQNSLQATLDSLHTQQRAWLSIEAPGRGLVPHAGSIFRVSFPFTNTGFTPAKNLQIFFDGGFFPEGIEPTYEHDGQPQAEGNLSPHGTSYFRYNGERCGPMKIPEHRMFVLYGAITYEDVFRQKHWCTYCFFVKGEEYEYCPKHNDIGDGDLPKGALVPATLPACGGEV
jgi:hypothetical protein